LPGAALAPVNHRLAAGEVHAVLSGTEPSLVIHGHKPHSGAGLGPAPDRRHGLDRQV